MHDNTNTDFCQNCVLGLQWNMKIKVKQKIKNKQTNKQTNKKNKKKKQTNKKQEMIDKLKT